jgi:hypothetical protein
MRANRFLKRSYVTYETILYFANQSPILLTSVAILVVVSLVLSIFNFLYKEPSMPLFWLPRGWPRKPEREAFIKDRLLVNLFTQHFIITIRAGSL